MLLNTGKVIKIAPSVMCADLSRLAEQLRILEEEGVDLFHFDIMDGHFVPNLALSPMIIGSLRPLLKTPFDAHLMVDNASLYLSYLYGIVDSITIHIEAESKNIFRRLAEIKKRHIKRGVALCPATPLSAVENVLEEVEKVTIMTVDPGFAGQPFIKSTLNKITALNRLRQQEGLNFEIEVDGSINPKTFNHVIKAGANVLVVGSSGLFSLDDNLRLSAHKLKHILMTLD